MNLSANQSGPSNGRVGASSIGNVRDGHPGCGGGTDALIAETPTEFQTGDSLAGLPANGPALRMGGLSPVCLNHATVEHPVPLTAPSERRSAKPVRDGQREQFEASGDLRALQAGEAGAYPLKAQTPRPLASSNLPVPVQAESQNKQRLPLTVNTECDAARESTKDCVTPSSKGAVKSRGSRGGQLTSEPVASSSAGRETMTARKLPASDFPAALTTKSEGTTAG